MTASSRTPGPAARRVLVVLGTRPKAIKLAPVVLALRARAGVDVRVCATGQHADADHLCAEPQVSVAEAAR